MTTNTRFVLLLLSIVLFSNNALASDASLKFNDLLKASIQETKINYSNLCSSKDILGDYIKELSNTVPEKLKEDKEKIAFWINVYNAYSLKFICDRYPIKSLNQLNPGGILVAVALGKTIWDRPWVTINSTKHSLKEVDHTILRPTFADPRIQFALACGAVSCPILQSEVYSAEKLDEQLAAASRKFFSDPTLNTFDTDKKTATMSPILNWNVKYFGGAQIAMLKTIAGYLQPEIASDIAAEPESWKIKYGPYDLKLNDKR